MITNPKAITKIEDFARLSMFRETAQEISAEEYLGQQQSTDNYLYSNYEVYVKELKTFIVLGPNNDENPYEYRESDLNKLQQILYNFNNILIHVKPLFSAFLNDGIIHNVIDIFLALDDIEIIRQCTILISNYSYMNMNEDIFCSTDIVFKLVGSLNSADREMAYFTRLAICNLMLNERFYQMRTIDEWGNDIGEISDSAIFTLRYMFGMLYHSNSFNKFIDFIKEAIEIFIRYHRSDDDDLQIDEDIPYFALEVVYKIMNNAKSDEQKEYILAFITEEFITRVFYCIAIEGLTRQAYMVLKELLDFDIDLASIIDNNSINSIDIQIGMNSVNGEYIHICIMKFLLAALKKKKWCPNDTLINTFINTTVKGSYAEKKYAIKILSLLDIKTYNMKNVYPIFLDLVYIQDESLTPVMLGFMRDMLYNDNDFTTYLLNFPNELQQLHDQIFNEKFLDNPAFKEISLTIDKILNDEMERRVRAE